METSSIYTISHVCGLCTTIPLVGSFGYEIYTLTTIGVAYVTYVGIVITKVSATCRYSLWPSCAVEMCDSATKCKL